MKYIASWSGGKDSTASIILAHENNEPLDIIIFSEVMFDENISGELPEHLEFIHRAKKVFEEWGYTVLFFHSNRTYMDCFNAVIKKSSVPDRIGKKYGFPMAGRCVINSQCKMKPIKNFYKKLNEEYICYVGLAVEERKRLDRIKTKKKIP